MLLNKQLWSIYQMASKRELIKALLLYDFEANENELNYKFIVICTDPAHFLIDLDWVNEIDCVWHIEKERSFYQQSHIYFNCCAIFQSGWSSQFIFIKNDQTTYFFKQRNIIVFIDRDFLVKSEQIRMEAMNFGQWKEPPTESELQVLACDFYEGILQVCRIIKQQRYETLLITEHCIKRTLIHLVQWVTYFGNCFLPDQLKEIKELIDNPSKLAESISFQQLLKYLQLANHLFESYCNYMNCHYETSQTLLLKEYIEIMLREEHIKSDSYKTKLIRVN